MNNKGKEISKPIIIVLIILLIGVVGVIFILNLTKNKASKPISDNKSITTTIETTTTEMITTTNINGDTVIVDEEEKIVATNFRASLANIIYGNRFLDDYHVTLYYSGVKFSFNCSNYDEFTKVCKEGNAQLNSGSAILPLYTYTSEDDNYLNNPEDYFIIINDNYIVLTYSKTGVKPGVIKIYSRNGEYINTIENTITGFKDNNSLDTGYYPSILDGEINYYICENNSVISQSRNLTDLNTVTYTEILEGATCQ